MRKSNMRKWVVFRLVAGSVLLLGLSLSMLLSGGSSALASARSSVATPPPDKQVYCKTYEQALAAKLKVTMAELAAANKSALQTTIQKAYTNGDITKEQETNLLSKVEKFGSDPCADLAMAAASLPASEMFAQAHQAIVTAVAGAVNLPPATLEQDLASGQSVEQIAAAQHVSLETVNAAYLGAVQTQLKSAVASGMITQSQSDAAYAQIQGAVSHGKYPLLHAHK